MFVKITKDSSVPQHYTNLVGETVEVTKHKVFDKECYRMVGILYFEELPRAYEGKILEIDDCLVT